MLKRIGSRLRLPASLAAVALALAVAAAVATAAQPLTLVVNGEVLSGASPQLIGGRVYVPLRVVGDATGLTVAWNDTTKTVTVDGYATPPELLSKMRNFFEGLSRQQLQPGDFGARFTQLEAGQRSLSASVSELKSSVSKAEQNVSAQGQVLATVEATVGELADAELDVAAIVEKAAPGVVGLLITVQRNGLTSYAQASGIIVTEDGQIITNRHVIEGMTEGLAFLNDGRVLPVDLWSYDADVDLAWLKVDATGLPLIEWAPSDSLAVGDKVVAFGNPLGFRNSATAGIVSGLGRSLDGSGYPFVQFDAAVNPGNSGGPLLDREGRVVGIVTAKYGDAENMSFAIPVGVVRTSSRIGRSESRSRAYLGVVVWEPFAASYGLDSGAGVIIDRFAANSPAQAAGLQRWDEILKIGDIAIRSLQDMRRAVDETPPNSKVTIRVRRGSLPIDISVIVGAIEKWRSKTFPQPPQYAWEGGF